MKIIVFVLLVIHACIHLVGVSKAVGVLRNGGFSNGAGEHIQAFITYACWLIPFIIILVAAIAYVSHWDMWWASLLIGVLASQVLIFLSWSDAKAGTILNIAALLLVIPAFGQYRFGKRVAKDISRVVSEPHPGIYAAGERLQQLPAPVQLWLKRSGALQRGEVSKVWLRQSGYLRTSRHGKWMPSAAEQYFTVKQPAFVWQVKTNMNSVISFSGRDMLYAGKGNMLIKLFGIFTIVDASGTEIDQGSLLRYLGEMCWFPVAALQPYVSWDSIDTHRAKATIVYNRLSCSGIFTFNENGDIVQFEADRYMSDKGRTSLEHWVIPITGWDVRDGVRMPVTGEVTWKLKYGDFSYFRWEIRELRYSN